MTDDIVIRLRKRAGWCLHGIDPNGAYDPYPRPESCERCNELHQIANEIEHLRAEVTRLGSFLHPIGTVVNGYSGSRAETTWIGSDGTITNHDPDTEIGFWVRLFHNECDRSAYLERETERLRKLMEAFVSAWERSELGENNGTEYFNAVHAMRMELKNEP